YPNGVDAGRAVQVAYNTMIAHAKAAAAVRAFEIKNGKVGIILNLTPSYHRSKNAADSRASRIADLFFNGSFLDPAVLGEYPRELMDILGEHGQLPVTQKGDNGLLKDNTADILGVNYYQPRRVKAKESLPNPYAPFMPDWYFDNYEMP